jgi:hypothetical protein
MPNKLTVEFDLGELKISGLKIRVSGERDEANAVVRALTGQVLDAVRPALTAPAADSNGRGGALEIEPPQTQTERRPRKRSPKTAALAAASPASTGIDFRHDPGKYGNPLQTWKVVDKCIWLLYVLDQLANKKDISSADLAVTYNRHFKATGQLYLRHIPRELGRAKTKNPSFVGEDNSLWFLTDAGKKRAKDLIKETLNSGS